MCNTIAPRLIDWLRGQGADASYQTGECALRTSIADANEGLRAQLRDRIDMIGSGAVIAIAMVLGTKDEDKERVAQTLVANVGDCRVYAIGKKMTSITDDHSLSACNPSDAPGLEGVDQMRRLGVAKVLGMTDGVEPALHRVALRKHIKLLLCSPGVTLHLKDEEILSIVGTEHDPESACRNIMKACADRGTADDVSVIVVQREDFAPSQ